ncbi:DUF3987 domain-containing protein [Streptomyces montanus]|uniref:DUF3987 domain-containing protein n=1 Tax=Streptomyces montanus TaxID=2580423 RepID=A0A5R9FLC7_9ACTN|nr:SLATT domain-containing protein [Streptomyces montanus]TLS41653.1 DUF3987 domain-containing protein [Streptomyces montanus]
MDSAKASEVVADWHRRCRQSQRVHYDSGTRCTRINAVLGLANIVLAIFVSSGAFYIISAGTQLYIKVITGVLSVLSVVTAVMQALLRYEQRAAEYKAMSAEYGALRRKLELMVIKAWREGELLQELAAVKERMDELAARSPAIPPGVKKRAVKNLESKPRKFPAFAPFDDGRDSHVVTPLRDVNQTDASTT